MFSSSSNQQNVELSEKPERAAALTSEKVSGIRSTAKPWRELAVLLAITAIVRLFWLYMIPASEGPDEPCHIWVAQFLAEHARLPHVKDIIDAGYPAVYGPMPQMGYVVPAVCGVLFGALGAPFSFRFGCLLMGLASVGAAHCIGRELFPREKIARLALPVLMIFHPQLTFVQAYTNSDSTVSALGTALTFLMIRFINRGVSPSSAAWLGFLLGWTALSKYSSYAMFVGSAVAFIGSVILHRSSISIVLKSALAAVSVCALTCGWWFVRQLHEYPTDLLGSETTHKIWVENRHVPPLNIGFVQVLQTPIYWEIMLKSYIGVFGYMKRYMWAPLYTVYEGVAILATLGGAMRCIQTVFRRSGTTSTIDWSITSTPNVRHELKMLLLVLTMLACIVPTLAAITFAACSNFPVQGRYLLGVEAPILLLTILGLRGLGPRAGTVALLCLLIFNIIVHVISVTMLFPIYGTHFGRCN